MKKIVIIPLIILLSGVGCNNQQEIINEQQKKIDVLTKKVDLLVSEKPTSTPVKQVAKPKITTKPSIAPKEENLEVVLLNYKVDVQEVEKVGDLITNASYKYPEQFCPNVISSREDRSNAYYSYRDMMSGLENKYGKYKLKIPYIDNNLYGRWQILTVVERYCLEAGYNIN